MRRALLLLLASALLAPLLPPPAVHAASATPEGITEAFTITNELAKPPRRFEAFDAAAVAVFDLDGDGAYELIANNDNNHAYVFDGGTGTLVAELATTHPGGSTWGARELNGISVGDVNGNRIPDVVIANSAGYVTAFEATPSLSLGGGIEFTKLWETLLDPTKQDPLFFENRTAMKENWTGFPGLDGAAFLADVTGDGKDEVFAQLDNVPSQFGLYSNGTVGWWSDQGDGNGAPVAADIDGDGRVEVVFATDGGQVFVRDGSTGLVKCKFWAGSQGAKPGSITTSVRLADLTGDGKPEIVFGARQAVKSGGNDWMQKQHAHYFALRPDCRLLWHKTFEWGNPLVYMHAAPVDVDGDGKLDVVFQDWNTIGHYPGNWEVTGKSNLFALKGTTGNLVWRTPLDTYWSNKDIAVADVIGDDALEILAVAPREGQDGITLLDLDGKVKGFVSAGAGWSVSRGPAVADLDGDGTSEIIVPVYRKAEGCAPRNLDVGCREGAIKVFHTGKPLKAEWDGVFLYSEEYDYTDKERRAPTGTIEVTQADAPLGRLAVDVKQDAPIRSLAVKRTGTKEWIPLEGAVDSRYEAPVEAHAGETILVRALLDGPRLAFGSFDWVGRGPGRIDGVVLDDAGAPLAGARVELRRDDAALKNATTDAAGRFSLEAEAGNYTILAEKGAVRAAAKATVKPGEITRGTIRATPPPEESRSSPLPAPGAAAAALSAAVVALALGLVRPDRRRPGRLPRNSR